MLERVDYPEQLGVDSEAVLGFTKYLESINFRIDSLLVLRHGKVAAEINWKPNESDEPHDLFSLSKSVTATAIGIAVDEGIISLDTCIYKKYFPEKLASLKGIQKQWAEKATIHDVISMRFGKSANTFDNKETCNWLDSMLDNPFKFEPGTDWLYISENAYLLSWILQKETGLTMTEYLTPRLFEPLGIKTPYWEKSHDGIDAGGWGLRLTVEDVAKISILYLNKGVYNGKRIFSEDWFNKAVYPYTMKTYPIFTDKTNYGYQIWIDHENNDTTYRFTGLFCQQAFLFPEYDACVVMTASDAKDGQCINGAYNFFPKAFIEPCEPDDRKKCEYNSYRESRVILPHFSDPVERNYSLENKIDGRKMKLISKPNLSTQGAVNFFLWRNKVGKMNDMSLTFEKDCVKYKFKEKNTGFHTISAGFNGKYIRNDVNLAGNPVTIHAQAAWNRDGSFELFLFNLGKPQAKRLKFRFSGDRVRVRAWSYPGYAEVAKFNIEFNNGIKVPPAFEWLLKKVTPVFELFYSDQESVGKLEK